MFHKDVKLMTEIQITKNQKDLCFCHPQPKIKGFFVFVFVFVFVVIVILGSLCILSWS